MDADSRSDGSDRSLTMGDSVREIAEAFDRGSLTCLAVVAVIGDDTIVRSLVGRADPVIMAGNLQMLSHAVCATEFEGRDKQGERPRPRVLC